MQVVDMIRSEGEEVVELLTKRMVNSRTERTVVVVKRQ